MGTVVLGIALDMLQHNNVKGVMMNFKKLFLIAVIICTFGCHSRLVQIGHFLESATKYISKHEYESAMKFYKKASDAGSAEAKHFIAWMHEEGKGVERNYEKALEWYHEAAWAGHKDSQHKLGDVYSRGKGVEKDHAKAFSWYKKAAEQGHADSQYEVAEMHNDGTGVKKDKDEAKRWYQKSAEKGHLRAKMRLGLKN